MQITININDSALELEPEQFFNSAFFSCIPMIPMITNTWLYLINLIVNHCSTLEYLPHKLDSPRSFGRGFFNKLFYVLLDTPT